MSVVKCYSTFTSILLISVFNINHSLPFSKYFFLWETIFKQDCFCAADQVTNSDLPANLLYSPEDNISSMSSKRSSISESLV